MQKHLPTLQKLFARKAIEYTLQTNQNSSSTKEIGVIYQALGSGLTHTTVLYLEQTREELDLLEHGVLVVSDRLDMQQQLAHVLNEKSMAFDIPKNTEHLEESLKDSIYSDVVLTTLQKLKALQKKTSFTDRYVIVGYNVSFQQFRLFDLFPNAVFLHFSSVPINQQDTHCTIEQLGYYGMKAAVKDKVLTRLAVESRTSHISRHLEGKEYFTRLVEDMFEHFRKRTANGSKKAIIRVPSIKAIKQLERIIRITDPLWFLAGRLKLISSDQSYNVNQQVIHEFKQMDSMCDIVITVDMLLIGFDLPILDTVYVIGHIDNKKLISLMNILSRKHSEKEVGLLVDYGNNIEKMKAAIEVYG